MAIKTNQRTALCQFTLDLTKCKDWYRSDDEYVVNKDEICEIIKFLAAG